MHTHEHTRSFFLVCVEQKRPNQETWKYQSSRTVKFAQTYQTKCKQYLDKANNGKNQQFDFFFTISIILEIFCVCNTKWASFGLSGGDCLVSCCSFCSCWAIRASVVMCVCFLLNSGACVWINVSYEMAWAAFHHHFSLFFRFVSINPIPCARPTVARIGFCPSFSEATQLPIENDTMKMKL